MLKKIIIGVLVLTVVGAGGAAFAYSSASEEKAQAASAPEPILAGQGNGAGQNGVQQLGESIQAAEGSQGEPWQESGIITEMDDYGIQITYQGGLSAYIELGPPDYWQNQGVTLQVGQSVEVTGSINEGMIHASQVKLDDGQVLQIRTETGQPLWSGGVENGQGQNASGSDGEHIPEPKALVDEWITVEGTLMSFQGGNMTMSTSDGEILAFQTGQPRFFAEQGVTFQVEDAISVIGFYENDQFMAGDITQVSTGLRVMLRDPNGRPLWAGPGNGNGNSGGSTGGSTGGNGGENGSGNGGKNGSGNVGGNSLAHGKGA